MAETPTRSIPTDEAARLAAFIRSNPSALDLSAADLAAAAEVSPAIVSQVIDQETAPEPPRIQFQAPNPSSSLSKMKKAWTALVRQPALFVFLSTLSAFVMGMLLNLAKNPDSLRDGFLLGPTGAGLLVVATVLHFAAYIHHRSIQVAIRGSAALYVLMLVVSTFAILMARAEEGESKMNAIIMTSGGLMITALLYCMIGMLLSVVADYLHSERARRNIFRLSRQELMERMFEIQERLELASDPTRDAAQPKRVFANDFISNHPYLSAVVLGFVTTVLVMLIPGSSELMFGGESVSPTTTLSLGVITILSMALQIFIAYCARGVLTSVLVSLVFYASGVVSFLIPAKGYGQTIFESFMRTAFLPNLALSLVLGVIGGLAGVMEERRRRDLQLRQNDPNALLAELVQIRRLLSPGKQKVVIAVVDAEKSSVMKANADPFVAEWSFRAYQQLLEKIAMENGGSVVAVMGDGAILKFASAADATFAAWKIHDAIEPFNANVNRLSMPFRLRIGIHQGTVSGHIEKVQFSDVIDIAAHVEAASPVAGVTVTELVYDELGRPPAREHDLQVDNFKIFQLEKPTS